MSSFRDALLSLASLTAGPPPSARNPQPLSQLLKRAPGNVENAPTFRSIRPSEWLLGSAPRTLDRCASRHAKRPAQHWKAPGRRSLAAACPHRSSRFQPSLFSPRERVAAKELPYSFLSLSSVSSSIIRMVGVSPPGPSGPAQDRTGMGGGRRWSKQVSRILTARALDPPAWPGTPRNQSRFSSSARASRKTRSRAGILAGPLSSRSFKPCFSQRLPASVCSACS